MIRYYVAFLCLFLTIPVFGESSDLRFLDGLSERGLFESAEYFYSDRIHQVPELEKIPLAAEFVRTLTRWTLQTEPNRRSDLLQKRKQLEQEFLGPVDDFSNPERTLALIELRFQSIIGDFSLGEEQRLEAAVVPNAERPKAFEAARQLLYDAVEKFKECSKAVEELRQRVGSNADPEFERRTLALSRAIKFQWGLAQESIGLSFPAGSDDRNFSLNEAANILSEVARLQIVDAAVLRSRIELAGCFRLLGDLENARTTLAALQNASLNVELRFRASTELLRYQLAVGQLDAASKEFSAALADSTVYPEFDLARLELFLAVLAKAPKDGSEEALENIIRLIRDVDRRSGPYWGRRARLVLLSSESSLDNAELLKSLADEQYRNGRYAESVRLYDRASTAAEKAGDAEDAYKNAVSAVAVLDDVAQRLETSTAPQEDQIAYRRQTLEALRSLAIRFVQRSEAPELHLKAVDGAAKLVLENHLPVDRYVELLLEHAEHWPTSEKTPPLLLRAAWVCERQERPADALALLEKIPNSSNIAADAVGVAGRCFEQQKDVNHSEVADWFEKRLSPNVPWSDADVQSALKAVEHRLRVSGDSAGVPASSPALWEKNAQEAERLLRLLFKRRTDLSPTDKAKALSCLVSALTLQNRQNEAAKVLDQLTGDNFSSLPAAEQRNLLLTKARVFAEIGKVQDSVNLLSGCLKEKEYQNDREFRETLAEILSKQDQPGALALALKLWKVLEEQSPKNSEVWWNAKENGLRVLLKQGRKDDALKEFEVLRLLQPELGGATRKARFEGMFIESEK